ncbi:MFS transporter [Ruegeria sp. HKCCD4884]|uniref:MFS transporter n=1 Tax=Ruegeria sp. HKCCD4884 TaxID=2683022 RepID=UPI001491E48A|nr:MFS transporter [Ruegeria sp. HKCCD4884]NOD95090.1 MFS transporter [Ruegeria sp. HKCCD4884]
MTQRFSRKSVIATTSGNVLEWYDFTVYGFLAPVIGRVFFPEGDHFAALLSAFAVLAVGYAVRPIGSVIFGHIGDRMGRKPALLISVIVMGLGSLAIALLPTYDQIGISAAILLVAIRVVQGLSVAGEFTASGVMTIEQSAPERQALNGSLIVCAMLLGCVLGAAVPALMSNVMSDEQVANWGWRLPFLFGALIAALSAILRRDLQETLVTDQTEPSGVSPVVKTFRKHFGLLLKMVILLIPTAVIYFMIFVYAASYLTDDMQVSSARALDITTVNLLLMALAAPLFGLLAGHFGVRAVLLTATVATILFAWPLWALMHQSSITLIFLGQLGLSLVNSVGWALAVTTLTNISPPGLKCSTVAIGYNSCMALFGGTTPFIATYLVNRTGDDFAPVYYLIATAFLSLFVIWQLPALRARWSQNTSTVGGHSEQ